MGGGGGRGRARGHGFGLPLAAPIGLSPLHIPTLCGSEHILVEVGGGGAEQSVGGGERKWGGDGKRCSFAGQSGMSVPCLTLVVSPPPWRPLPCRRWQKFRIEPHLHDSLHKTETVHEKLLHSSVGVGNSLLVSDAACAIADVP